VVGEARFSTDIWQLTEAVTMPQNTITPMVKELKKIISQFLRTSIK
jgi:hypothetical protein